MSKPATLFLDADNVPMDIIGDLISSISRLDFDLASVWVFGNDNSNNKAEKIYARVQEHIAPGTVLHPLRQVGTYQDSADIALIATLGSEIQRSEDEDYELGTVIIASKDGMALSAANYAAECGLDALHLTWGNPGSKPGITVPSIFVAGT